MKKEMMILFSLVFLLTIVGMAQSVDEKVVIDDWVKYNHRFTFEGENYSVNTIQTGDSNRIEEGRIVISGPNGSEILQFEECKKTEVYEYCFDDVTYEGDKVAIDEYGQAQAGLRIKIVKYIYKSDLTVDRWFEKKEFKLYETGEATIVLRNQGDEKLENIYLEEKIPEGFSVTSKTASLQKIDSQTLRVGPLNLLPGNKWEGSYQLKSEGYFNGTTTTSIVYDGETDKNIKLSSTDVKLTSIQPYTVSITTFEDQLDVENKIKYEIKIKNNEDKTLEIINMRISTPLNMYSVSDSKFSKSSNNVFNHQGSIKAGEEKTFTITMSPSYDGKYWVTHDIEFVLKGKETKITGRQEINIKTEEMSCYFDLKTEEIKAGNILEYDVVLENSDETNYYEFYGSVTNPLSRKIDIEKANIEKGKIFTIPGEPVIIPLTEENQTYTLKMNVKYRSDDFEHFECKNELPITVQGGTKYLDIAVKSSDQNIIPGSQFDLTILVQNLMDQKFTDVSVEHEIKEGISNTGLSRKLIDELNPLENLEAYTTKITVPKNYNKTYFEISVTINSKQPEYQNTIVFEVPVNIKTGVTEELEEKPQEIIKKDPIITNESYEEEVEVIQEVTKENLIQRTINFIKNLFKGNK